MKQPVEYVKDVAMKGVIVRLLGKLYNAATGLLDENNGLHAGEHIIFVLTSAAVKD